MVRLEPYPVFLLLIITTLFIKKKKLFMFFEFYITGANGDANPLPFSMLQHTISQRQCVTQ